MSARDFTLRVRSRPRTTSIQTQHERGIRRAPAWLVLLSTMVSELVYAAGGYAAYSNVRSFVAGRESVAVRHGRDVLDIERLLHLSFEKPLQAAALHWSLLVRFFDYYYVAMYGPFVIMTGIFLFVRDRAQYVRLRRSILLSGAIGLVIFTVYPVAPPRLLGLGFADTIHMYLPMAGYANNSIANQFAAIPSFHFGWCALSAVALYQSVTQRGVRAALCVLVPLMLVTIVATGNHLWIDAVVGVTVVAVAYRAAPALDLVTRVAR
jgi:hypothetical protein